MNRPVSSQDHDRGGKEFPVRWERLAPSLLMLVTIMLLGGSVQRPIFVMTTELAAIAIIAAWIAQASVVDHRAALPIWICVAVILVLAALQLTPLSAATWAALPGHETVNAVAAATGTAGQPRPLSLDPDATLGCLLATLPGIAMGFAAITARRSELNVLLAAVIVVAALGALMGALQIAGGDEFYLYLYTHRTVAVGVFANRNHNADLLLIGMILLAGRLRDRNGLKSLRPLMLGLGGLFAIATVTTGSRLGMAILPFAMLGSILLIYARQGSSIWLIFVVIVGVVIVGTLLAFLNPTIHHLIARYQTVGDDPRLFFWSQTKLAIVQFWPTGSGLGTFVPVYQSIEALDTMPMHFVNHAHNDYVELILETGITGLVTLLGYGMALSWAIVRGHTVGKRPEIAPAALGILVLLVHSLGDYPLRTPTLLAVFGLLNGIVFAALTAKSLASRGNVPQ